MHLDLLTTYNVSVTVAAHAYVEEVVVEETGSVIVAIEQAI